MSEALDLIRGAARDMRRDGLLPCIHPRLQALSPCPEAAAWLVDAYNRRLLEYYVIALWSGANGHRAAYVIVKKILTDHPRRCGAIYAGPALARLGGRGPRPTCSP